LALSVILTTLAIGAAVDLELMIYPNKLSLPLIGAGLTFALIEVLVGGSYAAFNHLGGGVLAFVATWGTRELYFRLRRLEALGEGDIKICTAVGLFLGIKGFIFFIFAYVTLGSIIGLPLLLSKRIDLRTAVPSGGFYALALALAVLFPWVPDRYLDLFDQPYQSSQLYLERVGRLQNDSFGAGVRDDR
jgi:prepilin signal peptidase PulO-like enzyme (type II secretory pathway)